MKNVIIICEGQSEQIFIRNLIERKLDLSKVSFGCLKLQGQKEEQVPYEHTIDNSSLKIIILNAQNDERVLSVIKDKYQHFSSKYNLIIGLRDMYSESYPGSEADSRINLKIRKNIKRQIRTFDLNRKVRFFFMIMEFESWLLSLENTLTEFVFGKTGEIPSIHSEPEKLFRPSHVLKSILGKYELTYRKHYSETQSILSCFQDEDLQSVIKGKKSPSFQLFLRYCSRYVQYPP